MMSAVTVGGVVMSAWAWPVEVKQFLQPRRIDAMNRGCCLCWECFDGQGDRLVEIRTSAGDEVDKSRPVVHLTCGTMHTISLYPIDSLRQGGLWRQIRQSERQKPIVTHTRVTISFFYWRRTGCSISKLRWSEFSLQIVVGSPVTAVLG